MTLRRLIALWVGVLGEMLIITAELIEETDQHDQLAIDEITEQLARVIRGSA